jgi:hypothetical protein
VSLRPEGIEVGAAAIVTVGAGTAVTVTAAALEVEPESAESPA